MRGQTFHARRRFRASGRAAAVFFLAALMAPLSGCRKELPVYSTVPAFTLTDHHGTPFGSEQLKGKPWVANFIFTRCPTICPAFTAKMERVQKQVIEEELDVRLVSFSVDPAHDTPEVLATYAKEHGATESWHFLTGDPQAIQDAVVRGLKIAAQPVGPDDDLASVFHGSHFVLVDADLRIRGYYESGDKERVEALHRDLATLARP